MPENARVPDLDALNPGSRNAESAAAMGRRITNSIGTILNDDMQSSFRPHMVWSVKQILAHIGPDDLTTAELAALVSVLIPAHSRWIDMVRNPGGVPGRVELRLLDHWTGDDTPADLVE